MTYLEMFRFIRPGIWIHATAGAVHVNEDYGRTYEAFTQPFAESQYVVRNASGSIKKFRSAEAAAKHLVIAANSKPKGD